MDTPTNVHHIKPTHLSIEGFKKLNRSKNTAFNMELLIRGRETDTMSIPLVPEILSYIKDDIDSVLQEVKSLGMCDSFLKKTMPEDKE